MHRDSQPPRSAWRDEGVPKGRKDSSHKRRGKKRMLDTGNQWGPQTASPLKFSRGHVLPHTLLS